MAANRFTIRRAPGAVWLLATICPAIGLAQRVSVGVTAGVPISPVSQELPRACLFQSGVGCGRNDFEMKPYAIGATGDVGIAWGISVETGFLYERFHRDYSAGLIAYRGGGVNFGQQYGVSANGWLFPFLLKYTFMRKKLAPFVVAGATLRHLGSFEGKGIQLDFYLQPYPEALDFPSGRDLDAAITAGAGVRWRTRIVDVMPEIRFLRWTSVHNQPAQNQAMLVLGLMFPIRR